MKSRADLLLVARGLAPSRAKAQALISQGLVTAKGVVLAKPSQTLDNDTQLSLAADAPTWVGRGALKLLAGLDHFALAVEGKVALDLGASTGGFCEVLLSRGAAKVFAVDVGHGQLHDTLKADPRVVMMEGTDARALTAEVISPAPDLITADLSFISLKLALPAALKIAADGAGLIALVKPQFEAGRDKIAKGGIVKDDQVRQAVCADLMAWLNAQPGWRALDLIPSPLHGGEGNQEFLLAGCKKG